VAQPVAQPIPHAFAVPAAAKPAVPAGRAGPDLHRAPGGLLSLPSRSVADALSGIRLPCDLVPLIGLQATIDPTHVVFAADGHPAHEVGSRVGDELERIGFELTPIDETTLHAVRDSYLIEVRMHPDAASARGPAGLRFPTAAPRSVVVEFRIV
jgi:hypothetical protein